MAQNNVLQYVGARYVPVFYNNPNGTWDWLSGVQYEPLTIVKYGTSTYTSKQLVPATVGAPNTAPDYWALTGDYNGAIVGLQNDISVIQSQLPFLSRYDYKSLNVLFCGDSYGTTSYGVDSFIKQWGVDIINAGGSFTNISIAGLSMHLKEGRSYSTVLESVENPERYNVVIIEGFANDNSSETLNADVATTVQALSRFINAKKLVVMLSKGFLYDYYSTANSIATLFETRGVPVTWSVWDAINSRSDFTGDNAHLSQQGANKAYAAFVDFINGCSRNSVEVHSVPYLISTTCTKDLIIFGINGTALRQYINDNAIPKNTPTNIPVNEFINAFGSGYVSGAFFVANEPWYATLQYSQGGHVIYWTSTLDSLPSSGEILTFYNSTVYSRHVMGI